MSGYRYHMVTDTSPDSPDPAERSLSVAGVRLDEVVEGGGPFGSLFVGPGSDLKTRAQLALDAVPVPAPHAGKLLESVENSQVRSQVVISNGALTWRFLLEDPLAVDLARFGDIPSIGPIIEASQVTTPHAVVTVENDVYGVTSFGSVDSIPVPSQGNPVQLDEPAILEALDHLIDQLRSSDVQLVALMGTEKAIADVQSRVQKELPLVRCNAYPTDDIDRDLLTIADEVVRDAATLAAERRTHELAHFRQSRSAAQTQEGIPAIGAIEAGSAQRLLVHDDISVEEAAGVTRFADRAIVAAIRAQVPITMIPNVPEERGPRHGLGVILHGHGTAAPASASDPQRVDGVQLGV